MRWVETNKGENQSPNISSRLVAWEIRTAGQDFIQCGNQDDDPIYVQFPPEAGRGPE